MGDPIKIPVEALEQAVCASAVPFVRMTWCGSQCWGTVLSDHRCFVCQLMPLVDPRMFFNSVPEDSLRKPGEQAERHRRKGTTLIVQGKAGAVAGCLCWFRPARTWHWVDWAMLLRQQMHSYINIHDDPDVPRVGERDYIDFGKIVGPADGAVGVAAGVMGGRVGKITHASLEKSENNSVQSISCRIVQAFERSGLSKKRLSDRSGVQRKSISRVLGGAGCTAATASRLLAVLER